MKRLLTIALFAGCALAVEGCASVSNGAKATGRAALRAAGVSTAEAQPTETAQNNANGHWSEEWVWEGDER